MLFLFFGAPSPTQSVFFTTSWVATSFLWFCYQSFLLRNTNEGDFALALSTLIFLLHLLAQGVLYFDVVYHVKSAEIIPSSGSFPCICYALYLRKAVEMVAQADSR